MRCYCGHFFYQMCGSTSPTVPNNERLVILEELGGKCEHIGWFSAPSGWWMILERVRLNGDKMPHSQWCSISIGNITGWREIIQQNSKL
jgi:hypothetical protein